MRVLAHMVAAITLAFIGFGAHAAEPKAAARAGDECEITKSYETSQESSDDSSTSMSSGSDAIVERVIAERADGLELEYDFPRDATPEERSRSWQFPARIFHHSNGSRELLNRAELEARLEKWLKAAEWSRSICGRWIFTWNAFHIDCDPQSVLKTIGSFDLGARDLGEGAALEMEGARAPGVLTKRSASPGGAVFVAEMAIDPDSVFRSRAEADVVAGEISQNQVTLESALRERTKEPVSGTITVTFETDSAGKAWRRTKVTKLLTTKLDGTSETEIVKETIERRLLAPPAAGL